MRYFIRFTYNGTSFHGSQTQPNGITVQEVTEQAFSTILRQPVPLTFAGRTDAGVHALEMFAHFDIPVPWTTKEEEKTFIARLNSLLPDSIAVRDIRPVREDAHARFSALSRTYIYKVTETKDPFNLHLATQVVPGLDYDLMNQAAQLLVGRHDFASFCKVHTDVKTTFCTVTEAHWQPIHQGFDFNCSGSKPAVYQFTITADRFLRNMVRAVVGTLMEVGRHRMTVEDFQSVIEARNRCSAGQSALPDGLYLAHIEYSPNNYLL